jgi:thiol-disulfide isomerase/thioredoxin
MPRLIGPALSIVFCIVLILAISGPHSTLEAQNSLSVPKVLQRYQATNPPKSVPAVNFIEGKALKRTLADYRGRGVILNFWATWCGPCVREMPQLDRLNALIRKDGIDVLTVSEDRNGIALIEKFYQINGLKHLPLLRDAQSNNSQGKLMSRLAVRGLPTTILINAQGQEVGRVVGPAEWDKPDAVKFLRGLLAPKQL